MFESDLHWYEHYSTSSISNSHAGTLSTGVKRGDDDFENTKVEADEDEVVAIEYGQSYPEYAVEVRAYAFKPTLAELQMRDADKSVKYRGQYSGEVVGRGIPESIHVIKKVRWWKVKFMEAMSDGDKSKVAGFWVPLMTPAKGLQMVQFGNLKSVSMHRLMYEVCCRC